MKKQKIKPYHRCLRCGSPCIYSGRGPYPKYCIICRRRRDYEYTHKSMIKKQRRINEIAKRIDKYIDYPMQYDDYGVPYIDQTHANWDNFIRDGICIKFLGSVSEWDLDQRIFRLLQQVKKENKK